jgi:cytochrome P450
MSAVHLPKPIRFSPYEEWRCYYEPQSAYGRIREEHGETVSVHFQGEDRVAILSADAARQVLSVPSSSYDAFWREHFQDIAGPGSIWVFDGERHRRERQLLSPAFHAAGFYDFGDTFREIARLETDKWRVGQIIRTMDTTLAIGREVVLRVVLGLESDEQLEQGRQILLHFYSLHPLSVFFRSFRHGWFPPWARYSKARQDFEEWIGQILVEREPREGRPGDALTYLLSAQYEDGSPITLSDLCNELGTILLSGHETTAAALAWALYELGRNPETLERLRAELDILGPDPGVDALSRLPYLTAVCNETLRLHTILAEIGRLPNAPIEIQGYEIPAGRPVVIAVIAIHHDPGIYPEPERFRPERFLERTYSSSEFMPFGGGHRRCLGAPMAQVELPIILADIVTRWDFEPAGTERNVRRDIGMQPKNGVRLRITGQRGPRAAAGILRPQSAAVPV